MDSSSSSNSSEASLSTMAMDNCQIDKIDTLALEKVVVTGQRLVNEMTLATVPLLALGSPGLLGQSIKEKGACKVCGDRAFYVFYGALACDSCRTFFRRQVLQNKVSS